MSALLKSAERLRSKATADLNTDRQTNTRRRVEMAANIAARAQREIERADIAARIAQNDNLPQALRTIKSLTQVQLLLSLLERGRHRAGVATGVRYENASDAEAAEFARIPEGGDEPAKLAEMGIARNDDLRTALRDLIALKGPRVEEDPVKVIERELAGARIPGFFPTPRPLAARMVEFAGVGPGSSVLEPSAGSGWIADACRDAGAKVDCCEVNNTLVRLLRAKGYDVDANDFLTRVPEPVYSAVILNPPFENGQDMAHVRHAYGFVRPGGYVVAILSPGPFFQDNAKAKAFRAWLETVNLENEEELPSGTFDHRDITQRTSVSARLIVIRK